MAAIGAGWVDGAWIEAGWVTGAWVQGGGSTFNVAAAETLSLVDSDSETASFAAAISESLSLGDSGSEIADLFYTLSEALSLTDESTSTTGLIVAVAESLVLTDTAAESAVFVAQILEALSLTDVAEIDSKTLTLTLIETLLLVDTTTGAGGVEMGTGGGLSMTLRQMRKLEREQLLAMIRQDDEVIMALIAGILKNGNRLN